MPKQAYFNLPDEKKQRIRNAVVDLFGTLPYEEVTTRMLVKEAGISMGSLYQYFDSKDEMYIYFIDEIYADFSRMGIIEDLLIGKREDYIAEKQYIDSMFFAPASVLEQYYFSKQTNTYRLSTSEIRKKIEEGDLPENIDEGLLAFLAGGHSLAVILYTRSLGINTADDHRRFWDQHVDTFRYHGETMTRIYGENYQKMIRDDGMIIDDAIYSHNKR